MQTIHDQLNQIFDDLDFANNAKTKTKVCRTWAKILTKQLRDYAKAHVKTWFGTRLSKFTPFKVIYSRKQNSLIVYGLPPNENVNKAQKYRLIPLGKESSSNNNWFRRVHIDTANDPKGVWITVKNKVPSDSSGAWYTKTSHTQYNRTPDGKYTKSGSRKYPFPAKWKKSSSDSKAHWCYQRDSVTDKLFMQDSDFNEMYENSLRLTLESMNLL